MNIRSLAATAAVVLTAVLLAATPAQAATSDTFTPQTISVPKQAKPVVHSVTPVGTVSLDMTATQTAYVVSKMRVNNATIRSLFDNEVVCQGPGGWSKNMVIGQNVYDTNSGSPLQDVTLYTRFLVHPGVAGKVTCTANVRSNSLSPTDDATYRLVSGSIIFSDTPVINATDGQPVQSSVDRGVDGTGVYSLNAGSPVVRLPALDYFTLPSMVRGLNVVGDVDLMICWPDEPCDKYSSALVKFTLVVNQWKSDGKLCQTDQSVQVTHDVPYWVHHKYVPLNKADFTVSKAPGCIPRFNAYVKAERLGGETAGIQGTAVGLTDSRGSTTTHASDMSHAYVLPY